MADGAEPDLVLTNIGTFLVIARHSFAKSQELDAQLTKPLPGGRFVTTFDPEQRSFKHSLISIVFAGVYLEALLYLLGCKRFGKTEYVRDTNPATGKKFERDTYEEKLKALGVADNRLLADVQQFRKARNELVHEKAHHNVEWRTAQDEAGKGIALIDRVRIALGSAASAPSILVDDAGDPD